MRSVEQATAVALSYVGSTKDPDGSTWHNECCHATGIYYGFDHSGYETAQEHWDAIPLRFKHGPTEKPLQGGLGFYSNGDAGHEVYMLGDGTCISNDIIRDGRISHVSMDLPVTKWGAHYLGWTDPWFNSKNYIVLGVPVALTAADVNLLWSMPILRKDPNGVVYKRTAIQELADSVTLGLEGRDWRAKNPTVFSPVGVSGLSDADIEKIANSVADKLSKRLEA